MRDIFYINLIFVFLLLFSIVIEKNPPAAVMILILQILTNFYIKKEKPLKALF